MKNEAKIVKPERTRRYMFCVPESLFTALQKEAAQKSVSMKSILLDLLRRRYEGGDDWEQETIRELQALKSWAEETKLEIARLKNEARINGANA